MCGGTVQVAVPRPPAHLWLPGAGRAPLASSRSISVRAGDLLFRLLSQFPDLNFGSTQPASAGATETTTRVVVSNLRISVSELWAGYNLRHDCIHPPSLRHDVDPGPRAVGPRRARPARALGRDSVAAAARRMVPAIWRGRPRVAATGIGNCARGGCGSGWIAGRASRYGGSLTLPRAPALRWI